MSFSDVTAAILKIIKYPLALLIFLQFPWDLVCNKNQVVFVFIANFIVLHYQLRFKMTVWKTVKTGSDVNLRTKCRFLLISTRWTQIYAYYIHTQRVAVSYNRHFIFGFTSLSVLMFFSTVILTGSWWRRKLNYNPIPRNVCRHAHVKFQENRIKTVAVTVLAFFRPIWRPWRH